MEEEVKIKDEFTVEETEQNNKEVEQKYDNIAVNFLLNENRTQGKVELSKEQLTFNEILSMLYLTRKLEVYLFDHAMKGYKENSENMLKTIQQLMPHEQQEEKQKIIKK